MTAGRRDKPLFSRGCREQEAHIGVRVSAQLMIDNERLQLLFRGRLVGTQNEGSSKDDPPQYFEAHHLGSIETVSEAQAKGAFHNAWISGTDRLAEIRRAELGRDAGDVRMVEHIESLDA